MTTIAYFISPHGFGHASRATAVMQAMQRKENSIVFTIFTTVPEWFFADQGLNQYEFIPSLHDVGLVQMTPFQEDLSDTLERLETIYPYSVNLVSNTVHKLRQDSVDLVICDIAPLGLVAARQCGIPSLLIENFTWDWIYKPFSDDYPQFSEFIHLLDSLFPLADYRIQAEPICFRLPNVPKVNEPISRSFQNSSYVVRNELSLADEKLVLVSFGGNKEQFCNLDYFLEYADTIFLIAGRGEELHRENNVISIPHNAPFYHPDLIQASDIVIGKAGYSTLAEIALAGKPFAFISRESNAESAVLAKHIIEHLPSIEITQQEYLSRSWIEKLPEILELKPTTPSPINGADLVAEFIFEEIL